jgi:hypothetical protein
MSKKKEVKKKEVPMHESEELEDLGDEVEETENEIDLEKLKEFFGEGEIQEIGSVFEEESPRENLEQQTSGVTRLGRGEGEEVRYKVNQNEDEQKFYENTGPSEIENVAISQRGFENAHLKENYQTEEPKAKIDANPWHRSDVNLKNDSEFRRDLDYKTEEDIKKEGIKSEFEKRKYEVK